MPTGKCVVVGAGSIGRLLLRHLSRDLPLICIDSRPEALEAVRELRGEEVRLVQGDATSRLVLEEAGVQDADTVAITTTSEKVNIEVARVLKEHFEVSRVLAVGITQDGIAALEELGVEVEGIFSLSATGLRNRLEHKTKAVHGIGLGKNEILEVEVHPYSRLANKTLASLAPVNWRLGIIYREGNIIIPRGDTVLAPRDKVILLGEPQVVKTVAEMLTFRFQQFPLEYGNIAVVCLTGREEESFREELAYVVDTLPLAEIILLCSGRGCAMAESWGTFLRQRGAAPVETRRTGMAPEQAIGEILLEKAGMIGLVVMARDALFSPFDFGAGNRRKRFLAGLSRTAACPILLTGGSHPYRNLSIPCLPGVGLQTLLETAFEISSLLSSRTEALFVRLSRYLATDQELSESDRMKKTAADMSRIYKAEIDQKTLVGNPVRAVLEALPEAGLLLADPGSWSRPGLFGLLAPDPVWRLVRKAPISVLLVPTVEESL